MLQQPKKVNEQVDTTIPTELLDNFEKSQIRKKKNSSILKSEYEFENDGNILDENTKKLPELFIKKRNKISLRLHLGSNLGDVKDHEFGSITNKMSI